jgi:FtsP/CotA-like multicopper oxidase with cupredoxin domain
LSIRSRSSAPFGLAVAAALLVACARSAPAPQANFVEPPALQSSHGTLAFDLLAMMNGRTERPAFGYVRPGNAWIAHAAPTLEVRAGDVIRVRYTDALVPPQDTDADGYADDTNLHFHGLTTSPNAPGDDVLATLISPHRHVTYQVRVNPDQPPGLYWYHPHPHGESSRQVGSGMAGAIVVEGIQNLVPSVAGLRERILVVAQAALHSDEGGPHLVHYCGLDKLPPKMRATFLRAHPDADESKNAVVTLNGVPVGSIAIGIRPGERELFRVVNATPQRVLDLYVPGERLEVVARDGVPLGLYPGAAPSEFADDVTIGPGARAEFVVVGPAHAAALQTRAYDSGPTGDIDSAFSLATLVDDGGGSTGDPRLPPALREAPRSGGYFARSLPAARVRRTVTFQENHAGTQFAIDHRSYTPGDPPMFVVRSGSVERWTLVNQTREVHVFHIHQVHFVTERIGEHAVPRAQQHWVDTVIVPYARGKRPGSAVILVDFRDPVVRGTFVFHCHILDHEDGGMMAKIRVV